VPVLRLTSGVLLLLLVPTQASTQTVTAEQAIENQRRQLMGTAAGVSRSADCAPAQSPDEIVVCGQDDQERHRLRIPAEGVAGEPTRLTAGEPPSGRAAMGADACFRLCHEPVKFNPIEVVIDVATAVRDRLVLGPDD